MNKRHPHPCLHVFTIILERDVSNVCLVWLCLLFSQRAPEQALTPDLQVWRCTMCSPARGAWTHLCCEESSCGTMGTSTLGKAAPLNMLLDACIQAFGEWPITEAQWGAISVVCDVIHRDIDTVGVLIVPLLWCDHSPQMTMVSCSLTSSLAPCCWCTAGMSRPKSWLGSSSWYILYVDSHQNNKEQWSYAILSLSGSV